MSAFPLSQRLLNWVRRRMFFDRLTYRTCVASVVLAVIYALALLSGRLTGLWGHWFEPWTVAYVPAVGLLIAALWPWQPTLQEAAHAVDERQATKDLFLTLTMLDAAPGDYKPLVGLDAEDKAPRIKAQEVVPWDWGYRTLVSVASVGVLVLGCLFVPTLDPFGKVAEAKQDEAQKKLIDDDRKINELRKAQLAQKDQEAENSEEVEQAIEDLKLAFSKMKKGDRQENQKRLSEHQDELGKLFREKMNSPEMKKLAGNELRADQKLGSLENQDLMRKMEKELQQGSSETMEQQLNDVQDKLERLAKSSDPVEKSKLEREVQKQLKELADFADKKAGSKALQASLERAQRAMEAIKKEGKDSELSKEAMEALKESLEVAQEECQALAQSSRDMKSLEEALKAISMAKQLNAEDQLDGEMMAGGMSLEEYEEMYAELMGNMQGDGDGEGDGEGGGGRGMGEGGNVPEKDDAQTAFKDEQSKSQVQKGRILLSLKTKGLSDSGDVKDEEYQDVIQEIRQNLADVIDQEQIPPGYHERIQKYFDTLQEKRE